MLNIYDKISINLRAQSPAYFKLVRRAQTKTHKINVSEITKTVKTQKVVCSHKIQSLRVKM